MLQTQCSKGRKLPTHFKGGSGDRSHSHIDNVIFQTRLCVEVNYVKLDVNVLNFHGLCRSHGPVFEKILKKQRK